MSSKFIFKAPSRNPENEDVEYYDDSASVKVREATPKLLWRIRSWRLERPILIIIISVSFGYPPPPTPNNNGVVAAVCMCVCGGGGGSESFNRLGKLFPNDSLKKLGRYLVTTRALGLLIPSSISSIGLCVELREIVPAKSWRGFLAPSHKSQALHTPVYF